jgi:serine/threonine protein kinase
MTVPPAVVWDLKGFSDFDVPRIVAGGATCWLYRATCKKTKNVVAIKLMIVENYLEVGVPENIIRESTMLRNLAHPNVPTLHDVILCVPPEALRVPRLCVGIVMEYMPFNLAHVIAGRALPVECAQYVAVELMRALEFVHSRHVMHRDIKPPNILCGVDGSVKLGDFGLAKDVLKARDSGNIHMTRQMVTRWYRAPEILQNSRDYDFTVDVWSLGCVIYEMLFGEPLFRGKDDDHTLREIKACFGIRDPAVPYWCPSASINHRCRTRSIGDGPCNFLEQSVVYEARARHTAAQLVLHPWLQKITPKTPLFFANIVQQTKAEPTHMFC